VKLRRLVFSLLDRRPLFESCTFISYESVSAIGSIEHLAHINDTIIKEYEEQAEDRSDHGTQVACSDRIGDSKQLFGA
jgi:hypothetical protein